MKILHVEDSAMDAELIAALIRQTWPQCDFERVATRAEYHAALEMGGFDLILSDYSLPDFDGLTALDLARTWCPSKPFLFLSGTIGEDRAVEALRRGAVDYLIKDRPNRLVPAIRQALERVEEGERRRRVEEALRQNQDRFRQIAENVADLIAVLDLAGRRIYVNPAYGHLLGDAEALRGTDSFADIHPDDREQVRDAFFQTVKTGVGGRAEYRLLLRDGSVRHIESQTSVIRDSAGMVANVLIVSRDVTERRLAEERLREQASLLDKARDAICVTDLDQRITYWNASAERVYGWKGEEAIGRKAGELLFEADSARFADALRQLQAKGEWSGELRPQAKTGEMVTVESRWTLVSDAGGAAKSILLISTDVTERRKLEAQLLRNDRMESIGMLAGGVAHDLNNVLAPILLAVDVLRSEVQDEASRQLLVAMQASAQHGAALVKQLLAFARGSDAPRAPLQIGQIIIDVQTLLRQTLPPSVQLVARSTAQVWRVNGDATQLKQVLLNLCINARDAMPHGGRIEITAEDVMLDAKSDPPEPGLASGPYVRVSVSDTGTGMSPEILAKIFDPFFSTKPAGRGTGLGLSMVAGVVKSHGGTVQVQSEPGRGTVFRIFLPALDAPSGQNKPPLTPALPALSGKGESVLLVDDDQSVRETLRVLLETSGYRVITASSGSLGIAEFIKHRDEIAVVLTDMMMPEVDGACVAHQIRAVAPEQKIIVMSGLMDAGICDEVDVPGPPIEFLSKPLTMPRLLEAIHRTLPERVA